MVFSFLTPSKKEPEPPLEKSQSSEKKVETLEIKHLSEFGPNGPIHTIKIPRQDGSTAIVMLKDIMEQAQFVPLTTEMPTETLVQFVTKRSEIIAELGGRTDPESKKYYEDLLLHIQATGSFDYNFSNLTTPGSEPKKRKAEDGTADLTQDVGTEDEKKPPAPTDSNKNATPNNDSNLNSTLNSNSANGFPVRPPNYRFQIELKIGEVDEVKTKFTKENWKSYERALPRWQGSVEELYKNIVQDPKQTATKALQSAILELKNHSHMAKSAAKFTLMHEILEKLVKDHVELVGGVTKKEYDIIKSYWDEVGGYSKGASFLCKRHLSLDHMS